MYRNCLEEVGDRQFSNKKTKNFKCQRYTLIVRTTLSLKKDFF